MSVELYSSIEELIVKEKNPAGYCLDEKWLTWLRDDSKDTGKVIGKTAGRALREGNEQPSIAIAAASLEIAKKIDDTENGIKQQFANHLKSKLGVKQKTVAYANAIGYAYDGSHVLRSIYKTLAERNNGISRDAGDEYVRGDFRYRKDLMTNFGYVFNEVLAILKKSERLSAPESSYAEDPYAFSAQFSRGYRDLLELEKDSSIVGVKRLIGQLERFARNSSKLGNYACIPFAISGRRCNSYKASGMSVPIRIDGEKKNLCVNDQFALFLEWINENASCREKASVIAPWEKDMLIDCCEGYYKQAVWYYKQAFTSTTQRERIANFAEYLKCVNAAIEIRSEQIVKTIKNMKKRESTQTK